MWPLDAKELAAWWERYEHLKRSYLKGFISRIEASDGLRNLRYRDDAHRCELREWDRTRAENRKREEVARNLEKLKTKLDAASS